MFQLPKKNSSYIILLFSILGFIYSFPRLIFDILHSSNYHDFNKFIVNYDFTIIITVIGTTLILSLYIIEFSHNTNNYYKKFLTKLDTITNKSIYSYKNDEVFIKDLFESLKKENIKTVISTTFQRNSESLKNGSTYVEDVLKNIFVSQEDHISYKHIFQIPDDMTKDTAVKTIKSRYISQLLENKEHFKKIDDIKLLIHKKGLTYPFINFTLIEYKDNSKEIFFGWLVSKYEGEETYEELFIKTKDEAICDMFFSIYAMLKNSASDENMKDSFYIGKTNLKDEVFLRKKLEELYNR